MHAVVLAWMRASMCRCESIVDAYMPPYVHGKVMKRPFTVGWLAGCTDRWNKYTEVRLQGLLELDFDGLVCCLDSDYPGRWLFPCKHWQRVLLKKRSLLTKPLEPSQVKDSPRSTWPEVWDHTLLLTFSYCGTFRWFRFNMFWRNIGKVNLPWTSSSQKIKNLKRPSKTTNLLWVYGKSRGRQFSRTSWLRHLIARLVGKTLSFSRTKRVK